MAEAKGVKDVEVADAVFSALAHPARRQILLSVRLRGQCSAGEIANRFDCSWPTTSRHLATLVRSNLLEVQVSGRQRIYSANTTLVKGVLKTWAGYF